MTLPLEKIREPQTVAAASGQVELRSVTKRYGNRLPVLEDINLSIPESEFVSIIGPSGLRKVNIAEAGGRTHAFELGEHPGSRSWSRFERAK